MFLSYLKEKIFLYRSRVREMFVTFVNVLEKYLSFVKPNEKINVDLLRNLKHE